MINKTNYYKPTPKRWRKLGDALLGVSTFVTAYSALEGEKWLTLTALGIGVVGKFLTNFFTDERG